MNHFASILILFAMTLSGCYDRHTDLPTVELETDGNYYIATLRDLCRDGCFEFASDAVCICRVTSSDQEGNFYRSIVVEDESGGAELKLGIYNSAVQYPVGLILALRLNGTAAMIENGVVQIGLPPLSFDSAPRDMEVQVVIDEHIIRSDSISQVKPLLCNISSLDTSLCGRFVAIEDIRHTPLPNEDCTTMVGYHRFTDKKGDAIFVHTSPYADFAEQEVPDRQIGVQGILYYESVSREEGVQFVIKPRFADDLYSIDNTI